MHEQGSKRQGRPLSQTTIAGAGVSPGGTGRAPADPAAARSGTLDGGGGGGGGGGTAVLASAAAAAASAAPDATRT